MKLELNQTTTAKEEFPAMFVSGGMPKTVILASAREKNHLIGVTLSKCPSWEAGYFSKTWEADSFTRLKPGSTVILTQE